MIDMLKQNLRLIFICFLSMNVVAAPDQDQLIQSHQFKFDKTEDDSNQIEQYEKEVQNLISRVEILEHKISTLEQQIKSTSTSNDNVSSTNQTSVKDTPKAIVTNDIQTDVFDVSAPKSDNNSQDIKPPPIVAHVTNNDDKKQYDLALASLKEGKLQEAEENFAQFLTNYPKSSLLSNAYFWYGETFFRRNIFDKATISYLKGYKQSPKGAKAADSLLKLAIALGELNKKQEGCGILAKLEEEFPNRPATSIKKAKDAKIKFGCN